MYVHAKNNFALARGNAHTFLLHERRITNPERRTGHLGCDAKLLLGHKRQAWQCQGTPAPIFPQKNINVPYKLIA